MLLTFFAINLKKMVLMSRKFLRAEPLLTVNSIIMLIKWQTAYLTTIVFLAPESVSWGKIVITTLKF